MRARSLLPVAGLILCGPALAASTADTLEKLNGQVKYEKAWKKCQRLSAGERENARVREACARAELEQTLAAHGGAPGAEALEAHWRTWATTAAGADAKNRHGLILLEQAGDDAGALLALVQGFEGTEAAGLAQAKLWEIAFTQASEEDTAAAWREALEAWPDHPEREWMDQRRRMALGREFSVTLSVGGAVTALAEISGGEAPPPVSIGALEVKVDAVDPSVFPAVDIQLLVEGEYVDFLDALPLAMDAAGVPQEVRGVELALTWAPQAAPLIGEVAGLLCLPEPASSFAVRVRVPGLELRYPFAPELGCGELASLVTRRSPLTLGGAAVTFGGSSRDLQRAFPEARRTSGDGVVEIWDVGVLRAHLWNDRLVLLQMRCDGDDACAGEGSRYFEIQTALAAQLPEDRREQRSFRDGVGAGEGQIVFRERGALSAAERSFTTADGAPHGRTLIYDEGLLRFARELTPELARDVL